MFWIIISLAIVYIILLLFNSVIYKSISNSSKLISFSCKKDSDCGNNEKCIFSQDYNQNICTGGEGKVCNITNGSLTQCDMTENSCGGCINEPPFECVKVTDEKPYIWSQGKEKIKIVNSEEGKGWCLPPVVSSNTECNPFTSDTILVKTDNGDGKASYTWGCYCNTNVFTQSNLLADCNIQNVCTNANTSDKKDIYVNTGKDCANTSDCTKINSTDVCWKTDPNNVMPISGNTNGKCFTKWSNKKDINPISGYCNCDNGLISYKQKINDSRYDMRCIRNLCEPGTTNSDGSCNCPAGTINCKDIPNSSALKNSCKSSQQCIPDPCSPGTYDVAQGICSNCPAGLQSIRDTSSLVGVVCGDVCGKYNPCGNRGTCQAVLEAGSNNIYKATCINCNDPFVNDGDPSSTCKNIKKAIGIQCNSGSECATGKCDDPPCSTAEKIFAPKYCFMNKMCLA